MGYTKSNMSKEYGAPGIEMIGLSKRYRGSDRLALDNVSLRVMPGEVYGFLGPNGAGKSTTIKLLMNFLQPSGGTAKILGYDIVKDSVKIRKSIGYLSGDMAMYPKMTTGEYFDYMSELQGQFDNSYQKYLIKKLKPEMKKRLGELSRGNKQKVGIIQALMHKPNVIIFDEPTTGLDPLMQEVFYELLREAKQRNATIFVSSHILSEVQKMCDRVGIIRDGKLVGEDNISELAFEATQTFDLEFSGEAPLAALKKIKGAKIISASGHKATIHIHGKLKDLLVVLAKSDITKMDARTLDLEEEFMHYYQQGAKK